MPKKLTTVLLTAAVVTGLTAGGLLWAQRSATDAAETPATTSQSTAGVSAGESKKDDRISYKGIAGQSALVQLREVVPDVQTKYSVYGEYVESMNGLMGGVNDYYWSFYVDGIMSNVGADSYVSTGGELIEWKYQNLQ